jgi:thiol-disulfide isomerase/thioredoxin
MKYGLYLLFAILFSAKGISQDVKKIKINDLEKIIRESKGPLVVNFWATFCKPCMEELPYFEKMAAQYKAGEVRFLLVSLDMKDDYPAKVKSFVSRKQLQIPVAWLDESNADYFCPRVDNSWSGAIPATLFVNNKTAYRKFTEEPLTEEQLINEVKSLIEAGSK